MGLASLPAADLTVLFLKDILAIIVILPANPEMLRVTEGATDTEGTGGG